MTYIDISHDSYYPNEYDVTVTYGENNKVFVLGNGESRKGIDLDALKQKISLRLQCTVS